MMIALGVILLVMALFLTVSVLMQHGKSKRLSGTIAGGAETFFGKTKGSTIDKMLSKITTVVAILFVVAVVVVYCIQDNGYMGFDDATKVPTEVESSTEPASDTPATDAASEEPGTEAVSEAGSDSESEADSQG